MIRKITMELILVTFVISMTIIIVLFIRILIWDNLKNLFEKNKSDEKTLEDLNKFKTFGDIKR